MSILLFIYVLGFLDALAKIYNVQYEEDHPHWEKVAVALIWPLPFLSALFNVWFGV